jgi:tRNA-specific 2-thiouridylase
VGVKIRYRFEEAPAMLYATEAGAMVRFNAPQRAITPGQAAVFYQGDIVLGGGVIDGDVPAPGERDIAASATTGRRG